MCSIEINLMTELCYKYQVSLLHNYSYSVSSTNKCSVDTILWYSPLNTWFILQYRSILVAVAGSNGGGDHLTAAVVRGYCCYWYGRDCFLSHWACFKYAELSFYKIIHNFWEYHNHCLHYLLLLLAGLLISRLDDMKQFDLVQ